MAKKTKGILSMSFTARKGSYREWMSMFTNAENWVRIGRDKLGVTQYFRNPKDMGTHWRLNVFEKRGKK